MRRLHFCYVRSPLGQVALDFAAAKKSAPHDLPADTRMLVLSEAGAIIGVAMFAWRSAFTVEIALASIGGGAWSTPTFLRSIFVYPFEVMGAKRLACRAKSTNADSIRMIERRGFTLEGRLREESNDGSDFLLFGMLRRECRFLKENHVVPEARPAIRAVA